MSPEQRLFVGVIVNAAQEAAGAHREGDHRYTIQESARAWFKNCGDDFRVVCELAGLEPREVRSRVLAYLARVETDADARITVRRVNQPHRQSGASIPDVARRAGVSATTVANVLRDRPHITRHTRNRVFAAVKELGYSRHAH